MLLNPGSDVMVFALLKDHPDFKVEKESAGIRRGWERQLDATVVVQVRGERLEIWKDAQQVESAGLRGG